MVHGYTCLIHWLLSKIVSDTLTFLDDTGLSMAASDNPGDISDSEDDEKDS